MPSSLETPLKSHKLICWTMIPTSMVLLSEVLDAHLWEADLVAEWMPEGPALKCSHWSLCSARHGSMRLSCEANHCTGTEELSEKGTTLN